MQAMREIVGVTGVQCKQNARYALFMRDFLRNAFALDDGKPCVPSAEERAVIERVADEVARRSMASTAIAFLEMSRPLAGVGAASIHFLTPIASSLANPLALKRLAEFLERRGAVDVLITAIETAESRRDRGCCEETTSDLQASDVQVSDVQASSGSTRENSTGT